MVTRRGRERDAPAAFGRALLGGPSTSPFGRTVSGVLDPSKAEAVDYGIICAAADEKRVLKEINGFLSARDYRKMYKWQDTSVPPSPERTFRISHYYCQFLKESPYWYFDLRPNADLDGKQRFPDHAECGWTLFTRKTRHESNSKEEEQALNLFFSDLIRAITFPCVLLHVYTAREDRF